MHSLEMQLEKLGLEKKESQTYLALFNAGKASAQELAKELDIPRSTVYGYLRSLVGKNLITEEQRGGSTRFVMNPPSSLERWMQVQKEELAEKEDITKHLVQSLSPHFSNHSTRTPKVIVAKGKREVEQMLYRYSPQWNLSYKKVDQHIMWGYQDHTFVEEYYKWHKQEWLDPNAPKQIRLFSNLEGVRQQKRDRVANREIKLLPSGTDLASSIWIHGEYVLLGNTRIEPYSAVLVYEPMLAENLRTIFKLLWRLIA